MKNLSSPSELQAAIDGNRREGRRAGYESYNMFPGPRPQIPLPPSSLPLPQISPLPPGFRPSFNGTGFPGSLLSKFKQYSYVLTIIILTSIRLNGPTTNLITMNTYITNRIHSTVGT